jgi:hypothetical protein
MSTQTLEEFKEELRLLNEKTLATKNNSKVQTYGRIAPLKCPTMTKQGYKNVSGWRRGMSLGGNIR